MSWTERVAVMVIDTTAGGLELAEFLAAKLCHDIAGPLGTIAGAVEMASEDPGAVADGLPIARDASQELTARLRLLRAAWGPPGDMLGRDELAGFADGLPSRRKVQLDLDGLPADVEFGPAAAQLVLNLLLLAAEGLRGSGRIVLAGDTREVLATIAGPRAAWPEGLAACIADPTSAVAALSGARAIQAPLTVLLAARAGGALRLLLGVAGVTPPVLLELPQG